jgi:hypothetical protein
LLTVVAQEVVVGADLSPSTVTCDATSYVASKNSEVFHRPDCKSAAKISGENLQRFFNPDY